MHSMIRVTSAVLSLVFWHGAHLDLIFAVVHCGPSKVAADASELCSLGLMNTIHRGRVCT